MTSLIKESVLKQLRRGVGNGEIIRGEGGDVKGVTPPAFSH